jgi:hypothetical protein
MITTHLPAHEVVIFRWHVTRNMHPILEQLTVTRRVVNQRAGMWAKAGEERQFLAAYKHVD